MYNHCVYTSTGRAFRLDQVSRGAPYPRVTHAADALFTLALHLLFAGAVVMTFLYKVGAL